MPLMIWGRNNSSFYPFHLSTRRQHMAAGCFLMHFLNHIRHNPEKLGPGFRVDINGLISRVRRQKTHP